MINAGRFISSARARGFTLFAGVPCSYFKSLINCVIDSDELRYVGAASEGDAVAVAAGASLGGRRSIALFGTRSQCSGTSPTQASPESFIPG